MRPTVSAPSSCARIAVAGVPVVALHARASSATTLQLTLAFDAGKPAHEAARVGEDEVRCRSMPTVAPSELVMRLSTASAAASVRRAISMDFLHRESPRMKEAQVRRRSPEQALRVRQARRLVGRRVARDRACRFHRALDRLARQVRRAGVAAALAEVHGDAQALVAVVFDGLDFAAAHGDRLADGGRDLDFGIGGATLPGPRRGRAGRLAPSHRATAATHWRESDDRAWRSKPEGVERL